jgi:hypothetical protein
MSEIAHCPRGGQTGILTNTDEQAQLSIVLGSKYLDEYIPLPGLTVEQQKHKIGSCTVLGHSEVSGTGNVAHGEAVEYWENEKGSHGWCCINCGKVVQWG